MACFPYWSRDWFTSTVIGVGLADSGGFCGAEVQATSAEMAAAKEAATITGLRRDRAGPQVLQLKTPQPGADGHGPQTRRSRTRSTAGAFQCCPVPVLSRSKAVRF